MNPKHWHLTASLFTIFLSIFYILILTRMLISFLVNCKGTKIWFIKIDVINELFKQIRIPLVF